MNALICCRIFRDVPSDITIEVSGGTFALHKVGFLIRILNLFIHLLLFGLLLLSISDIEFIRCLC